MQIKLDIVNRQSTCRVLLDTDATRSTHQLPSEMRHMIFLTRGLTKGYLVRWRLGNSLANRDVDDLADLKALRDLARVGGLNLSEGDTVGRGNGRE